MALRGAGHSSEVSQEMDDMERELESDDTEQVGDQ